MVDLRRMERSDERRAVDDKIIDEQLAADIDGYDGRRRHEQ